MTTRIRFEQTKLTDADEETIDNAGKAILKTADPKTAIVTSTVVRTFIELCHRQSAIMDKLELLEDKLDKLTK